jgi:hypothetical protein
MVEMDPVEASLRLDWAEQELEAKTALVADLQHHLGHLSSENVDLRARVDTLKSVQETLLSDKLAAEASLEALLREKAELSGENASLRAHAKDLARALSAHAVVEGATRAPSAPAPAPEGAGAPPQPPAAQLECELRAARLLAVRLLDVARCSGWAASGRSGAELWAALGVNGYLGSQAQMRAALVMALAEAAGVAAELRAAAPTLPAAEPLPPPPPPARGGDGGVGCGGGGGGGDGDGGEEEGGVEDLGGDGGNGAGASADGGSQGRGFFAAFFSFLVGDVEREREIQTELREAERAREARSRAERANALALRRAIQEGAELGKDSDAQKLLLP